MDVSNIFKDGLMQAFQNDPWMFIALFVLVVLSYVIPKKRK